MYERTYKRDLAPERKKTPREKRRRRFWGVLKGALALAGIAGIILLLRLPALQVREVVVEGEEVIDEADITLSIDEALGGNYLLVVPKRNFFFVPTKRLEHLLRERWGRLSSVAVRRSSFRTLSVEIGEYQEAYLWCGREGETICAFMDPRGVVFSEAPFFSGAAYLRLYGGVSGEFPFSPFPDATFNLITRYHAELPELRITPVAFTLSDEHLLTVVFAHRDQPATLLINPGDDPVVVLENLSAALVVEPLKSAFRSEKGKAVEYLDARYRSKVVYKFR